MWVLSWGLGLWVAAGVEAESSVPRVFSRSIVDSCAFVYRVESDIVILQDRQASRDTEETVFWRVEFFNAWKREPYRSELYEWSVDESGRSEWSLETMSVAKNHLFREMHFALWSRDSEGRETLLSPLYSADVGRRFGEACASSRQGNPPFVEREVQQP